MALGDGYGAALALLQVLGAVTWPCVFVAAFCQAARRRAVRGTRVRYVARSLHPVFLVGAMVSAVSRAMVAGLEHRWGTMVTSAGTAVLLTYLWHMRDSFDGDDDFWKGVKRRWTARRTRRRVRRLGLSGAR